MTITITSPGREPAPARLARPDALLPGFTLPPALEAHEPPEARGGGRDGVALMVSRRAAGEISHHPFASLPDLLLPGDPLPGGAILTLTARLWRARLSTAVIPYLVRHGAPIRYSHVHRPWPVEAYQTSFATRPASAEMPSAGRPFTPQIITRLVSRGVMLAPLTLHAGVSSLEGERTLTRSRTTCRRSRPGWRT